MSSLIDLYKPNFKVVESENNKRILRNSLLFPISKAFLESHPQYYDCVNTYEKAVETIPELIEHDKDSTINTFLTISDDKVLYFKLNIINPKLLSPNSVEACQLNPNYNIITPNLALAKQGTYCLTLTGDVNYSYKIINKKQLENDSYLNELINYSKVINDDLKTSVIKDGLITSFPLMLGSKWDTVRQFDIGTLIRSGEECEGLYGTFIVKGYIRYLIPSLKKPLNKAIVLHNDYDEQLSRCEIQYSRGNNYENSYFMVGAMLKENSIKLANDKQLFKCNEFGFSLQFNHPTMNSTVSMGKNVKKLINFVPIKILFAAFGCITDGELINYICPGNDDVGLITSIKQSVLYGYKHYEAYIKANIKLIQTKQNYIKLSEPLTPLLAKYIIGTLIMKDEKLVELNKKSNGNINEYRLLVSLNVDNILNERFMPAIGDKRFNSDIDRNTAICITLGNIVSDLYYIGMNLHASQSKQSLINKRIRLGNMVSKEFKSYWGVRLNKELISAIRDVLSSSSKTDFDNILNQTIKQEFKKISINQTASMIQAFCGNGSELSKIRNDIIEPKNQLFIWNKEREVAKSSDLAKKTVNESWENRMPHPSELFIMCPTETPDSSNVGKFRALGVHTKITLSVPIEGVIKALKSNNNFFEQISSEKINNYYTVSIDGTIVGYIHEFDEVETLYNELMEKRSQDIIPNDITVVLNHMNRKLDIWCDNGRLMTPFVIVENCFDIDNKTNNITIKNGFKEWLNKCNKEVGCFNEGIKQRYIEFMDCEMLITNALVAGSIREFYDNPNKYTHISMSNSISGIISAANPCGTINQGVRAGMSTNHLKQAMGAPLYKYPMLKFMNLNDILIAPQQSIVQPAIYKYLHIDQCAIGHNVTICFCQFKYNQDDSIIFNQESVNNGLLKCETFTTFRDETLLSEDKYEIPNKETVKSFTGNIFSYDKLSDVSSLPKEISTKFNKGDVLIGKVRKTDTGVADISVINKMPDANETFNPRPLRCVEKHYITEKTKNTKLLCMGQYRIVIQGDKVNSEHCQKATIGRIVSAENLPYSSSGHVADVYFNPLSVFKRKTYGQLYLSSLMKIAALNGVILENSSFGTVRTPEEITEMFNKLNIDNRGFETMYDAETGKKIGSGLFFGMCYYERQHHMVESKLNVRCKGGHDANTGMPTQGKARDGGLSFDRLSNSSLISSGSLSLNRDFHLNQCSKMAVGFCNICHSTMCYKISNLNRNENNQVIARNNDIGEWCCPICGKHDDIEVRYVSKAFPLANHIFNSINIDLEYYKI